VIIKKHLSIVNLISYEEFIDRTTVSAYRVTLMKRKKTPSWEGQVRKVLGRHYPTDFLVSSALIHPSYRYEHKCPKLDNFDRLEFFGDAILNYVVCKRLYRLFPKANEGDLSRLRSILVSRKVLFRIAKSSGISRIMQLGNGLKKQPSSTKVKIYADVYEALIAAVYFAKGLEHAEKFILKDLRPYFDSKKLLRLDPNPKSSLQELCQNMWKRLPEYRSTPCPRGIKTSIHITQRMRATAYAKTRKSSEESAARLLIRKIRKGYSRSKKASSGRKLRKAR